MMHPAGSSQFFVALETAQWKVGDRVRVSLNIAAAFCCTELRRRRSVCVCVRVVCVCVCVCVCVLCAWACMCMVRERGGCVNE